MLTSNQRHQSRLAAEDITRTAKALLHYLREEPDTSFMELPGFYEDVAKLESAAAWLTELANDREEAANCCAYTEEGN